MRIHAPEKLTSGGDEIGHGNEQTGENNKLLLETFLNRARSARTALEEHQSFEITTERRKKRAE